MLIEPECYRRNCKHFQGVRHLGEGEVTEVVHCFAFPNGIPPEIVLGDNLHLSPVEGDNGIQYEERSPEDE